MRFQFSSKPICLLAFALALLSAHYGFAQGASVDARPYPTVTDTRLEHPDAGDWLMYRRTYDGWGYSPLKQITKANIQKLSLAWSMSTDLLGAHETTAIVNQGRMFITTPQNNIIAIDAKTGKQLWRYARKYSEGLVQLHPTNRGVALYGNNVYMATTDCALVALDAATGNEVWTIQIDDNSRTGCYSTLAPLAVRGKIILGYSGGEVGVRGSINAFDALTGKRTWKTYTVPAPDEPGGETWKGDAYKRGGGSTWITGVYDPTTNTTFWGTGNPGPWVGDDRPGDNLYTDSTLALDADNGKIKNYHQYTPHDSWDWDEVSAPILIDTQIDGKQVKTATHAGRNGYLWVLDRNGLDFLHAYPFSNNNVFTSIDPKTGRPTVDESKRPGATQGAEFCPSIGGGKDWPPEAWSPQTKLLYIPANNNICGFLPKGKIPDKDVKGVYLGYGFDDVFGSVRTGAGASDHLGELQAWDLSIGKRVWQHNFKTVLWAPLLVTGGDILFAGGTPDRMFRAFDARNGDQLWSFPLPSGAIGVPTSFEIDGEQYVAVTTGWDLDARGLQSGVDAIQKTNYNVPQSGTILVFKLK